MVRPARPVPAVWALVPFVPAAPVAPDKPIPSAAAVLGCVVTVPKKTTLPVEPDKLDNAGLLLTKVFRAVLSNAPRLAAPLPHAEVGAARQSCNVGSALVRVVPAGCPLIYCDTAAIATV